jgi:hypothetical protein
MMEASRGRNGSSILVAALCRFGVLAFITVIAPQKTEADSPVPASEAKPWYDARLRAFFVAKAAQARQLAAQTNLPVASEVWPYFNAGIAGDWSTTTNLYLAMRRRAHQYEGSTHDAALDIVWAPILETYLAWVEFSNWKEKYALAFGNDIIKSIPPGSIYFGGTDPGRGLITAMSESHADGKPFFTITQNALADSTYLDYLRAMYGNTLYIPSPEDSQKSFEEYVADAQQRRAQNKLRPGEYVGMKDGRVAVSGQTAVMSINGLLAKTIFDRNPDRNFYIEESFPLDWMYPYLSPNGLIMKINRQPLPELSEELVQQDHEYWSRRLQPMIGDGLHDDTSVAEVAAFVKKVYLKHDLSSFTGDSQFLTDTKAQTAFSKLRSSIGGIYKWRITHAKTPEEKQRMSQEADFAYRQAFALCPVIPEAVFHYLTLLVESNRPEDARLLLETALEFDPNNAQMEQFLEDLTKNIKAKK